MATRRVRVGLAIGLTGALPGLSGTAQATDTAVTCDSDLNVANHTYKLTGNLSCSIADAGIRITANSVTLDLNGFTISGVSYPVIEDKPGVLVDNVTGARVTDTTTTATSFGNGTISNFDAGMAIVGGPANTVDKLNIVDNNGRLRTDCVAQAVGTCRKTRAGLGLEGAGRARPRRGACCHGHSVPNRGAESRCRWSRSGHGLPATTRHETALGGHPPARTSLLRPQVRPATTSAVTAGRRVRVAPTFLVSES